MDLKARAIEEVRKLICPDVPQNGFTAREYADAVGIHVETARNQLKTLARKGLLEVVYIGSKTYFLLKDEKEGS